MSEQRVVYEPKPGFHVEVGRPSYEHWLSEPGIAESIEWGFERRFPTECQAKKYADHLAMTEQYVRVVEVVE